MRATRAVSLALWVAPAAASACPVCARDTAPGAWLIIGALIAAPYLVALAVVRAVREAERGGES